MTAIDELRIYIVEARSRCYRGIANQNEKLTCGGHPSKIKIEIFEKRVAKYDRWLSALETLSEDAPPPAA